MITIVAGGRDFTDGEMAMRALDQADVMLGGICGVIEGGQRSRVKGKTVGGGDWWGLQWAIARGVPYETMPADWARWGRAMAGRMRNQAMITRWRPGALVALPGNEGTADMIERAQRARMEVLTVDHTGLVERLQEC
jgi:hypothetical protein